MKSYPLVAASLILAACSSQVNQEATGTAGTTVFEGARLITGDGGAPIENCAIVVVNNQFTQVGRRGEVQAPAGAGPGDPTCKAATLRLGRTLGAPGVTNR